LHDPSSRAARPPRPTRWQSLSPAPHGNGHLICLFVGSQAGGRAAATATTLIETAKLNSVDPQAWLADTLARIPDHKITRIDELPPWNHH